MDIKKLHSWQELKYHRKKMHTFNLNKAFANDDMRFTKFSIQTCGLLLDFSKNLISQETINLAEEVKLKKAINTMFSGKKINFSENRSALHTALRRPMNDKVLVNGKNIMTDIYTVINKMKKIVNSVHDGLWYGYTEKKITNIVSIGIGGSFLGPKQVFTALCNFSKTNLKIFYISNLDSSEFYAVINKINPETTLFIIASKSFSTKETIKNATAAREWIFKGKNNKNKKINRHFIAVSNNKKAAISFGISEKNILKIWDWVGGRYSMWSAIGLPIAISIGIDNFKNMLLGAYHMDQHFQNTNFSKNMPVILGLIGLWYRNFFDTNSYAILPYNYDLRHIPEYIQQLEMESNGKNVRLNGENITK